MALPDDETSASYLVFGATGGIGSDLCRRLASRGARLVLAARDGDRLGRLAAELGAVACPADATRLDEVDARVEKAVQLHGRLDGVANCVGSLLLKPAHLTSEAEWMETVATNLTTAFAVVRAGARAMRTAGGSIVLVSSAAGRIGLANHEAIAAAKAGVIGLTLSAAATYAARGIRVNCVAPGLVRTPMTARLTGNEAALTTSTGNARDRAHRRTGGRRFGDGVAVEPRADLGHRAGAGHRRRPGLGPRKLNTGCYHDCRPGARGWPSRNVARHRG